MKPGEIKVAQDTPAFVKLENFEGRRGTKTFLVLVYSPLIDGLPSEQRGSFDPAKNKWSVRDLRWPSALDKEMRNALETVSKEDSLEVLYQVEKFYFEGDVYCTKVRIAFSTMQQVPTPLNYARSLKTRIQKMLPL